mmetsp:Transcript_12024/g.33809  ORF Transcript_12024/g.33809 Transcript_12024/m.33809 type:complete len:371 (-) Transcript_12024:1010-2122(-)
MIVLKLFHEPLLENFAVLRRQLLRVVDELYELLVHPVHQLLLLLLGSLGGGGGLVLRCYVRFVRQVCLYDIHHLLPFRIRQAVRHPQPPVVPLEDLKGADDALHSYDLVCLHEGLDDGVQRWPFDNRDLSPPLPGMRHHVDVPVGKHPHHCTNGILLGQDGGEELLRSCLKGSGVLRHRTGVLVDRGLDVPPQVDVFFQRELPGVSHHVQLRLVHGFLLLLLPELLSSPCCAGCCCHLRCGAPHRAARLFGCSFPMKLQVVLLLLHGVPLLLVPGGLQFPQQLRTLLVAWRMAHRQVPVVGRVLLKRGDEAVHRRGVPHQHLKDRVEWRPAGDVDSRPPLPVPRHLVDVPVREGPHQSTCGLFGVHEGRL